MTETLKQTPKKQITTVEILYLLLAIGGLIGTWYYNIQFYLFETDTSLLHYIELTKTTYPARSFNIDLTVVALTFMLWYIPEARRLEMKLWWVFIPLTFMVALAFAFPLFLFFRSRALRMKS